MTTNDSCRRCNHPPHDGKRCDVVGAYSEAQCVCGARRFEVVVSRSVVDTARAVVHVNMNRTIIGSVGKRPFKNRDAVIHVDIRMVGRLTRLIMPSNYGNVFVESVRVDNNEQFASGGVPAAAFMPDESGDCPDAISSPVKAGARATVVLRRYSVPSRAAVPMRLVVRGGRFIAERLDRYGVSRTSKPMIAFGMIVFGESKR